MVRVKDSRIITKEGKRIIEAYGLSTDTKPTDDVLTGSIFIEIDTGNAYFYDEENTEWIKAGGA